MDRGLNKKIISCDNLPVPHVGWTEVHHSNNNILFKDIEQDATFYFVHSYYAVPSINTNILATSNYGIDFAAAVQKKNIMGVQFHPEKSQKNGLQLLRNFSEITYEDLD